MKITDFLDDSRIIPHLKAGDKKGVLKEMADWMASQDHSLDGKGLLEVLVEREKVSTTAIGEGVAIPHGKMP
ncbi:MAG: PTS sugar transporter subunit IIA, partial [Deltaproteobacteria bacterium]|nr:PTS sugar transporter subunit IIA [Deltaproteobacteria bacterium]